MRTMIVEILEDYCTVMDGYSSHSSDKKCGISDRHFNSIADDIITKLETI